MCYSQLKSPPSIYYEESIKVQCLLQPFSKLVMESNHTCLLLIPLLSPLIIWIAENVISLEKEYTFIYSCLTEFSSTLYTLYNNKAYKEVLIVDVSIGT